MEEGVCANKVSLAPIAGDKLLDEIYIQSKSTTGLVSALQDKDLGYDFPFRETLDAYQCRQDENSMRAFDKVGHFCGPKLRPYNARNIVF